MTGTKQEGMTINNTKRHRKKGALYLFFLFQKFSWTLWKPKHSLKETAVGQSEVRRDIKRHKKLETDFGEQILFVHIINNKNKGVLKQTKKK